MSFIKEVKTHHYGGKTYKETIYNEPKNIKLDHRDAQVCQIICCDPCQTTESKMCRIAQYTITGGFIGLSIGAPVMGVGAGPGFGIGCGVGFLVALVKIACDS